MLTKKQLERYADVLIWGLTTARTKEFKAEDLICIKYDLDALDLAEILWTKMLIMGMNPVQRLSMTPAMETSFYMISNDKQLVYNEPSIEALYGQLNGSIYLRAASSLTHLKAADSKKIAKSAVAFKPMREILSAREDVGDFGWTLCTYPTLARAEHAGITLEEYEDQIIKACFLDQSDPIAKWEELFNLAVSIKEELNSLDVEYFHIESDNGINLDITPGKQRAWRGVSGHNIPSFELFLSPDWRGTSGVYYADLPSYRDGNLVDGMMVTFKDGIADIIEAVEGGDFAREQCAMDDGANKVGEFSLTDTRFSKINKFMADTLFDENFGGENGNCHIAMGDSYSDTFDGDPAELTKEKKKDLGFNDSALHWDIVNTADKIVTAHLKGGKKLVIYEGGQFRI